MYVGILKKAKNEELIMTNDANHMSTIKCFCKYYFSWYEDARFKRALYQNYLCAPKTRRLSCVVHGLSSVVIVFPTRNFVQWINYLLLSNFQSFQKIFF